MRKNPRPSRSGVGAGRTEHAAGISGGDNNGDGWPRRRRRAEEEQQQRIEKGDVTWWAVCLSVCLAGWLPIRSLTGREKLGGLQDKGQSCHSFAASQVPGTRGPGVGDKDSGPEQGVTLLDS